MTARPWNQPSLQVYSLSSFDPESKIHNMNICTYVSKISLEPKLMLIAVYKGTKTLSNLQKYPHGILQILSEDQSKLIKKLGKQSGNNQNKLKKLELNFSNNLSFLPDSISYINLDFQNNFEVDGDHILFIAKIAGYKTLNPNKKPLTTHFLKQNKIIR